MKHLAALFALSLTTPAFAGASVNLPLTGEEATIQATRYSCAGGEPFTVQYVNVGPNRLAILPVDGQELVFVNVISGSGARYASGALEWWSKGETATLSDAMKDEGKPVECGPPA